jgi:hypothetical protein
MVLELLAPLPAAPRLAGAVLTLFAADRVTGAALSLLDVEFELECAFSPFVDDEVSDLLFDLRERLSTGIFPGWGSYARDDGTDSTVEEGGFDSNANQEIRAY